MEILNSVIKISNLGGGRGGKDYEFGIRGCKLLHKVLL